MQEQVMQKPVMQEQVTSNIQSINYNNLIEEKIILLNKRLVLLNDTKELQLRIDILTFLSNILNENLDKNILRLLDQIIFYINNVAIKTLNDPYLNSDFIPNFNRNLSNELKLLILTYSDDKNNNEPLLIDNRTKHIILNNILTKFNKSGNNIDYQQAIIELKKNILPRYINQIEMLKQMLLIKPVSQIKLDIINLLELYRDPRLLEYQIKLISDDINKLKK